MHRAVRYLVPLFASLCVLGSGCKREREDEPKTERSAAVEREEVRAATTSDIPELEGASYARSLVEQLDLVPPDADGYLVIRDLRPLLAQAGRIRQVMAGPLARAIPALAKLGGGTGEARLDQLQRAGELLELLIAGLEASGIRLDQGAVVALRQGAPTVVFAAEDLGTLGALASMVGEVDLSKSCGQLSERPGWYACSLGEAEAIASYAPAGQGKALLERLGDRLADTDLDAVNLAVSIAESARPLDAVLRTDPGLWELTVPMPLPGSPGQELLHPGPAPALRALVPGTSFMWARVDPAALGKGAPAVGPVSPEILTGEFWFGVLDDPNGMTAQAGIEDASSAAKGLQSIAQLLPAEAIEPEQLEGVRLELDRASIDLDGTLVPSIGLNMSGPATEAWAATLGLDPRARVWAYGDYLSVAVGEVQAIPSALARLVGNGPSFAAVATLPPTLARALAGGEAALVMHMVLDHWQAPPSEAELQALLSGLPAASRPSPAAISALFEALAPWSSVDLWLSRGTEPSEWLAHLSIVPFGAEGRGVSKEEAEVAAALLDRVLAGADAQAGYRELLTRFPDSPRATTYRARVGDAPAHHAAAGMVELGVLGALAIPALSKYLTKAKSGEAPAQTQSILSAALVARERAGSCEPLLGKAELTPPLSLACHAGEGGRCHPVEGTPEAPGEYPASAWADVPIWATLGYRPNTPGGHRFHYGFEGQALEGGGCRIIVRAVGDLDGDGVVSTYEREATITADGAQTLAPLRIENPEE